MPDPSRQAHRSPDRCRECTLLAVQEYGPSQREKKKTRPRLARTHNIASEVGPMLQDAFFFPTRSIREASARQHQARCSAQTGRCKLVCASCSTQVALCKLLGASCSAQVAPCKLVPASGSLQVALCKLLRASCSLQVALCKLLCASCSVQVALQVGMRKLLCATCSAQVALRKLLYASCILRRPPADQRGIEPATRRSREQAREPRQLPRTSSNNKSRKKLSSFCTSTTPIPAEGRAGTLEIAKNLEFLYLDQADPRRGSREHVKNQKNLEFLHLDHADPRRGSIFV